MRTRIKICGLTREQDVAAAVAAGADAVGFVLYPKSPRHVSAARAAELAQALPPLVAPVLLFVNATAAEVDAALHLLPHALLQFHGDETPAQCQQLSRQGRHPYWRAARIPATSQPGQARFDLLEFALHFSQAQALLLDAHVQGYGGGGKTFDWSSLPANVAAHLVLSGGLTPANVGDGIRCLRGAGALWPLMFPPAWRPKAPTAGPSRASRTPKKSPASSLPCVRPTRPLPENSSRLFRHAQAALRMGPCLIAPFFPPCQAGRPALPPFFDPDLS